MWLFSLACIGFLRLGLTSGSSAVSSNTTVQNGKIHTWWHETGEFNTESAVQPGNVRQSNRFSVQVSAADEETYYNSFVYQTIPRNGQGNILIPNDPDSVTTASDGITIESAIGMTMSWSSFLYTQDVWVKVSRLDGSEIILEDVIIRPTNLDYETQLSDNQLLIYVPYAAGGSRFSVEFLDNAYEFRDGCDQPSCSFVQNTTSTGPDYVSSYTSTMPIISVEPLDALLIFASPFEDSSLIPNTTSSESLLVPEGQLSGLNSTDAKILIFQPGVYYATSTDYLNLSSSVEWLYFAPGSYVKGAVEYHSTASLIRATGHGVLSGEQYVYQADPTDGFQNHDVDASPLRMWKGTVPDGQKTTWILNGPTINSPPFNSMDWYGDNSALSVLCTDYKQVGGFFGQTDGLEIYPGSVVKDVFYHTNDDTIKIYYSNVSVSNVVVYKATTAPVIQFGWASRNLSDILVTNIDVIHSRWNSNGSNPGLIGSNNLYDPSTSGTTAENCSTADIYSWAHDITFSSIRSEGISGPLMRIYALENLANITIRDVWIETFGYEDGYESTGIEESFMPAMANGAGEKIKVTNFTIEDFVVGCDTVTTETALEVGVLYWDPDFDVSIR